VKLDGTPNRKERHLQRTCAKKKVYKTFNDAARQADMYGRQGYKEQYVYSCRICGEYHLTTVRSESVEESYDAWEMIPKSNTLEEKHAG
jgi:hypothetical protein